MDKLRVLIISEQNLFGECLALALSEADPNLDVSWGRNCDEIVGLIPSQGDQLPTMIVVDLQAPGFTPSQTSRLAQEYPDFHIVVVGQPESEEEIVAYLEGGAADYLSTADSINDLRAALRQVLQGRIALSPERGRALFARLQELSRRQMYSGNWNDLSLTRRELQILDLVDKGKSNKQIAKELHLSLHTIKNHVHRILGKLGVANRREAAHLAHSRGWFKSSSHLPGE